MTLQRERQNTTRKLSKAVGTREKIMMENRQYYKKRKTNKICYYNENETRPEDRARL